MTEATLKYLTPTDITGVRSNKSTRSRTHSHRPRLWSPFGIFSVQNIANFNGALLWTVILTCQRKTLFRKSKSGQKHSRWAGWHASRLTIVKLASGIFYFNHCRCPTQSGPNNGENHWKIILARFRFTKDAESRYSPVEGEALALMYRLKSCRIFMLGCPDLLATVDH